MKRGKTFDCVQMKHDIQRKLMKEEAGLSWQERNKRAQDKILADPILGPWFQKLLEKQESPRTFGRVAEARPAYGKV